MSSKATDKVSLPDTLTVFVGLGHDWHGQEVTYHTLGSPESAGRLCLFVFEDRWQAETVFTAAALSAPDFRFSSRAVVLGRVITICRRNRWGVYVRLADGRLVFIDPDSRGDAESHLPGPLVYPSDLYH